MSDDGTREGQNARKLAGAGAGAVAVLALAAGLIWSLFTSATETPVRNTNDAEPAATSTTESNRPEPSPSTGTVLARRALEGLDSDKALTITVVGDSTGDADDEWVHLLARVIEREHDRTVVYNAWDVTSLTYKPEVILGSGRSVRPVTIWNASAAGQGPFYSQVNLAVMAPQSSDLVIVNHGHNFTDAASGVAKEVSLVASIAAQQKARPAIAIILQNPRTTRADAQDDNIRGLRAAFSKDEFALIDVASSFRDKGQLGALLLPDGVHPNAAGQVIWTDSVTSSLGL